MQMLIAPIKNVAFSFTVVFFFNPQNYKTMWIIIFEFLLWIIPISEFVIQTYQYILSKTVKPRIIPKIDLSSGIPENEATFVIIPTIISSKEKVKELSRKLEIDYLANKTDNLFFCLLGDCKQEEIKDAEYDGDVVIQEIEEFERLNKKYPNSRFPRFHFIYRNRKWNESEKCYLGWERKRGAITDFTEFLLGNLSEVEIQEKFNVNTMIDYLKELPKIKYIITLDSDTDLILNSAHKLVGAMAHILNKPEIENGIVKSGYGLIQPRVGINLDVSYKTMFTKIFAGSGGIDCYSNAISDIYQDNFAEGIFTGKGIFDLQVYSKILKNEIPENTVLSHDLLEGNYLRCGLATDILLMDGYPTKYNSYMVRLSRWIRGDWQIIKWLKNNKLNKLSKYKIFDNLRRSTLEISTIIVFIYYQIIALTNKVNTLIPIILLLSIKLWPYILEIINNLIFKREGEQKLKNFTPKIDGYLGVIYRSIISILILPHKAWISLKSIIKTLYRLIFSKQHLLEWMTSEEAEKNSKDTLISYIKEMKFNIIFGVLVLIINYNSVLLGIGVLWLLAPLIMFYISKEIKTKNPKEKVSKENTLYIKEIGKRTFNFFYENLNAENNYLIPDNYQEDRKNLYVNRTSSTNIGLSLLSVISGYDLEIISLEETNELLEKIIKTIWNLKKWNGHLYNWYNIKTLEPLMPRYISTVDSGNFVGYLYVVKSFFENQKNLQLNTTISMLKDLIDNTDFSKLYSKEHNLFSIGFNAQENKLTDSYYDLLASEARQASFIAIAKKDIDQKHWKHLSRTLTIYNNKKGLISWSGTAFEYLMPNINMPRYKGSLLDESIKFAEMCQIEYAKILGTPWGISESAFNVKDLHSNYQYKAFGIPWIGLKRGLADEIVISSYASVLAINDMPNEVVENLKQLEKRGMFNKYGFYESIDFSPQRVKKEDNLNIVKTYMAHHQALILLSINNFLNDNTFQKRFLKNPEIEATSILLQEKMPETYIVTKEEKEKPEKLKYMDYENYSIITLKKDEKLNRSNIISNGKYTIGINNKGQGFSKLDDIYINRFKITDDYNQGIFMYLKNITSKKILEVGKENEQVLFMPDQVCFDGKLDYIKTKLKITIDPEEAVEIRSLEIENIGNREETLEISSYFEPILSSNIQDFAHKAFNNLFLMYNYDYENNILEIKRRKRNINENDFYLETAFLTDGESLLDNEFEIDKEKLQERGKIGIPRAIKNSYPFSKKIGLVTDPIVSQRKTIKISGGQKQIIYLIISVGYDKELAIKNLNKYKNLEIIERVFEISKAKVEAESRYLDIKSYEIEIYQKILGYLLFENMVRSKQIKNIKKINYNITNLWKYGISGDLDIILVKIRDINDTDVIKQVLKMYEFFRSRNISIDLIFLDEEVYSYENYVYEEINSIIEDKHLGYLKNIKGGIFIFSKGQLLDEDVDLLNFISAFSIDTHLGDLKHLIDDLEEDYLYGVQNLPIELNNINKNDELSKKQIDILKNDNIKYFNEYGAFSNNGKEYLIRVNSNNRLPTVWSNILANEKFGTLVTENLGGYSWNKNSRLNRISAWTNDPFFDIPSEIIYLEDIENKKSWSIGLNPMPDQNNYNVIHGFGYSKYIHESFGITQELEVFVPEIDSIKVNILKLTNNTIEKRKIKILYYIKPVLGEDENNSNGKIYISYNELGNCIFAENLLNSDFKDKIYLSSSERIKRYTGDKLSFLGNGNIGNPDALKFLRLNNNNGFGKQNCLAIQIEVELDSMSSKEITINFGACNNLIDGKNIAYKYSKVNTCKIELDRTKRKWKEILEAIQVNTPVESINIMLNGWALYQTISSRLLGKTGFYQSGGAYGFRDQLQDVLCLKYINTEMMKAQILKHARHQFIEGDVEHWWHDETSRGIRTRFSDDLLWLVYVTEEYLDVTNDVKILEEKIPYLKGKILDENEEERYDLYEESNLEEPLYNHLIKAIEKSLDFGKNGFPKIGTGDWNDGFSKVGNKGEGESVWLGFFMYNVIQRFIPYLEMYGDKDRINRYNEILVNLKNALNKQGWDGRWYRRAYMDNGRILGSIENDECKIDSIAQSWAVISNAGELEKNKLAMESLENHLVDRENGIIKLLDPPFEKSKLEPGYIKSYMPGVRENGGQYTHSAIWAIIAEALLGNGNKAVEFYRMINPIEHSRTKDEVKKYKVEPYVISADIYGSGNLAGRGGWTWYTGSASWFYLAGIEYILGMKIKNGILWFNPCIPKDWKEYSIRYKFGRSIYNIIIKNPNEKNSGVVCFKVNGNEIKEKAIKLQDDGNIYEIEIEM